MKAILTGGGSGEQTKELDELFASLLDKKKPLLYIPIAIDENKFPYSGCLHFIKSTFYNLGIKKYTMWTEQELSNTTPLSNFSGVYIGGGNTFYLLKKLKESDLLHSLKKALKDEIPIYGGSAGAIIFGASIKTALPYDTNDVGLEDFRGLDIIDGHSLVCHFDNTQKSTVYDLARKDLKLLMLTEKNGIYVQNDSIRVIGREPAFKLQKNTLKEIPVSTDIKS